jgi:DNA-binding MarR family transcriptional regulator
MDSSSPQIHGVLSLISTIRDRANRLIVDQLKEYGIEDILPAHGAVLVRLFANETMTLGQVAKEIKRDKSTVTTLANRLERAGYIEKTKDPGDARVSIITLTLKGKELRPVFDKISVRLLETLYAGFSDLEKEVLVTLLGRMKRNL